MLEYLIKTGNPEIREKFIEEFKEEIKVFIKNLSKAIILYKKFESQFRETQQEQLVSLFVFNSFNNLINSFHLFISGYSNASGNLNRQFIESIAMAILTAKNELDFFDRFMNEGNKFPVHKSLNYVKRNIKHYKTLIKENWENLIKIHKSYNDHSHSSAFTLATPFDHDRKDGSVILGPIFVELRKSLYKKEILSYIQSIDTILNLLEGLEIEMNLNKQVNQSVNRSLARDRKIDKPDTGRAIDCRAK
ncbi:MAG: hypothetical protein JW702_07095 [Clostridiales bacterium]|nr:hypothetical protein [Clostridiales bacterium]